MNVVQWERNRRNLPGDQALPMFHLGIMKCPLRLRRQPRTVSAPSGLLDERLGRRGDTEMGLTLCNNYSQLISTAIMFYSPDTCGAEGGDFEMMGWWSLNPGSCALVYANDLEDLNQYWYYYAIAEDGTEWSGPFPNSVPKAAFDQCWGLGIGGDPNDFTRVAFRELDIGDNDDYTLTFVA
jgi:uncharacterized membrane protein